MREAFGGGGGDRSEGRARGDDLSEMTGVMDAGEFGNWFLFFWGGAINGGKYASKACQLLVRLARVRAAHRQPDQRGKKWPGGLVASPENRVG